MKKVEDLFRKTDIIFEYLSFLILAVMVISITLQVIFRIFDRPLAWSVELSQYLFIWLTFIAGYVGARRGQHIGVEYFHSNSPKILGKLLKFLSTFLPALYFGVVFYYCVSLWPKLMAQKTAMLKVPMATVYLGMMIGLIMMTFSYLYLSIKTLTEKDEV